ncbi:pyridoxine/pyridoxamine 5'-phosphate oxidase [Streptomyces hoynatensis]|uniref:Pyridoxal 5'-phosphate synthase n=1 Tax=Streptomyces hoynatensis TaxID=1141874 RepID=A0A3A9ZCB4_9ACTN|nr:pyridoxal 5'-phosphate synthase [Streptomyces hoynatensis]RKN44976.1 pyridoxal 5'-phosphate synthase [Streptomyces hoynatensis]
MSELRALLRRLEVFTGELPEFDAAAAPAGPAALFTAWLLEAVEAKVPEPHAMSLATAGRDGNPAARVLIVKDVLPDPDAGWRFAAERTSPKGAALAERPYAAATFYWPDLGRQVRLRGPVAAESAEAGAADFLDRGPGARAEALLGRQSRPLHDPAERAAALAGARERVAREPDLVAPGWTLYTLRAEEAEFFQGAPDRDHIRLRYRRAQDGSWSKERLWP